MGLRCSFGQVSPEPGSALPPLHNAWLHTLTGIQDPGSEPKSTCGDCVMCAGVERSGTHIRFSPDVKCCSYVPNLANFLAGRSLLGPGRESVRARIARRAGVTPFGLGLSHGDIRRLVESGSQFGRAAEVVCPHFVAETQGCAIWQTRNAVCSTWFCKHERGAVGLRFWHAVRDLLSAVEERLSLRCVTGGGLADDQAAAVVAHRRAVREIITVANSGRPLPELSGEDESAGWYERMWGEWAGREEDWFVHCAESVGAIDDDELVSSLDDLRELVDAVDERWHALTVDDLPEALTFAPGAGSQATVDVLRLVGYSPFDPVVLPAALLEPLRLLDGRPIAELPPAAGTDAVLDHDLLRRLHDFAVAVAPAQ